MRNQRHAKYIARLVLAWFALSLGVAVASPLMQSQAFTMICSSSGMIQLSLDGKHVSDQGNTSTTIHTLNCPLCLAQDAPPDLAGQNQVVTAPPTAAVSLPAPTEEPATSVRAAPLPARGPPSILTA